METLNGNENLPTVNSEETAMQEVQDAGKGIIQEERFHAIMDTSNEVIQLADRYMAYETNLHKMDLQFNAYMAELNNNMQQYRERLPIIRDQFKQLNNMMDKILDKVLDMDPQTDQEFDSKMKMMDMVDTLSNRLATAMSKLL